MFYSVHATKNTDGVVANEIFAFPDLNAAKANHFYFLSSCYSNPDLSYFMAEVVDADGVIIVRDSWHEQDA